MARAPSRLTAIPVAKDRRTNPPGAKRMRCRRLTIGSSTAPVVPERARPSRAIGSSGLRPRPRNRPRSVSHSTGPCILASTLNTWTAHTRASSRARGRRAQTRAALSGKYSVSTKSLQGGVGQVLADRRQGDLGVARDLELARPVALVGHGQAAHLDV